MKKKKILEVKNLTKKFPIKSGFFGKITSHVHAVDDISFHVLSGETIGVVGESGCGKSTLGRSILQLDEISSGRILYNGLDLKELDNSSLREIRKKIQIIFQDPFSSLNPRMSVLELLKEPFIIHKMGSSFEQEEKVRFLLNMVSLPEDALDKYPHEFSGGQRQRIGIARAIALEPEFIVADSPVSALDVSVQSQILNLLTDLKKKLGISLLFISHDLAVVEHISDRISCDVFR